MLKDLMDDYLLWMISKGYTQNTWERYECILRHFSLFVSSRKIPWDETFTLDTLKSFQKETGSNDAFVIKGLAKYLFKHKRISRPIEKQLQRLPEIYEEYLLYYPRIRHVCRTRVLSTRKILTALYGYLKKRGIVLSNIKIEQLDEFLSGYNAPFAPETRRGYRCLLRGFLRYLYREKGVIKKDLAPLLASAPLFSQARPPKFLRPHEVQRLLSSIDTTSSKGLRRYAIFYLAYSLGLRPREISLIRLDDIYFCRGELILRQRKCANPIKLPLSEEAIKAIAAYIVGARPKSSERALFLCHKAPYAPVSPSIISRIISAALRDAHLQGSAYWLRHTYAQGLLDSGASIFEIKEMLGHDSIQSTDRYIHINTRLMREIIFDEIL